MEAILDIIGYTALSCFFGLLAVLCLFVLGLTICTIFSAIPSIMDEWDELKEYFEDRKFKRECNE